MSMEVATLHRLFKASRRRLRDWKGLCRLVFLRCSAVTLRLVMVQALKFGAQKRQK